MIEIEHQAARQKNRRRGTMFTAFTYFGLLIVTALVILLTFKSLQTFYLHKEGLDGDTRRALKEDGIDVSTHKTILDSTRAKLNEVNKRMQEQEKQSERLLEEMK